MSAGDDQRRADSEGVDPTQPRGHNASIRWNHHRQRQRDSERDRRMATREAAVQPRLWIDWLQFALEQLGRDRCPNQQHCARGGEIDTTSKKRKRNQSRTNEGKGRERDRPQDKRGGVLGARDSKLAEPILNG